MSGAPDIQLEKLDALKAAVQRLEASEARLRRRSGTLSEHLLAAERRNAALLPAEDEIKRLRGELERLGEELEALTSEHVDLTEEYAYLSADAERLEATLRSRNASIAEVMESETWKLTAPLRTVLAWLRRR